MSGKVFKLTVEPRGNVVQLIEHRGKGRRTTMKRFTLVEAMQYLEKFLDSNQINANLTFPVKPASASEASL